MFVQDIFMQYCKYVVPTSVLVIVISTSAITIIITLAYRIFDDMTTLHVCKTF